MDDLDKYILKRKEEYLSNEWFTKIYRKEKKAR